MDKKIIYINSIIIAVLAIISTISGLFWNGLYKHNTISVIAQMMGQDLITLVIVVPLLLISLYFIYTNSLKGRLIWMGILFYFIYTYAAMSFLASYNQLFLVYVAIFSISVYTFLGELVSLDVSTIKKSFKPGVTIKVSAVFLIIVGLMLSGLWLNMIIDSLLTGTAPAALGSYTTLVIQALDLGIVVPAAILSGILLLKNNDWGYTLASVFLIKGFLLGTAIISMMLFMIINLVTVPIGEMILFYIHNINGNSNCNCILSKDRR